MSFLDLFEGDQAQAAKIQPTEGTRLPSTFGENMQAAWSDGHLFGQSIARQNAQAAVLEDYLGDIRQKTGSGLPPEQIGASGPAYGISGTFDAANAHVAKLKKSYPDLDLEPLSEEEIDKRATEKAQAAHREYEDMQGREKARGGGFGSFLGSAAASATDPINILALAVAPETGGSVSILSAALRWGALAGASQAAIEASSGSFKDQVQPGYLQSGQPFSEIAGAAFGGAVLGGSLRTLGNLWTRAKTGAWPQSVRDAGNLIESEAHVAETNIFPGIEGEVAHREALTKTIDDIMAGRPVSVEGIVNQKLLDDSRALMQRLRTAEPGEPVKLPIINQRAIELVAEHEKLLQRDAELASMLDKLPAGDASAADRLNRLEAVERQIAEATDPAAKRALNERRDQILVDTNPERLRKDAEPIFQRQAAESERAAIADRISDIADEHARLKSDYSLMNPLRLPELGQGERIPTGPKGQFEMDLQEPGKEAPKVTAPEPETAVRAPVQTPEEMAKTLAEPAHQEAIRADIDRARATSDVQVPGLDENGNHTMVSVDKAMDEVDAYKAAAEQIQACANPMQETQPMKLDVTERGRSGRPISTEPLPKNTGIMSSDLDVQGIAGAGEVHIMHDDAGQVRGIYGSKAAAEQARDTAMRKIWDERGPTHGDEFGGAPPRVWKQILNDWNREHPDNDRINFNEAGYNSDGGGGRKYFGGLEGEKELQKRLEAADAEWDAKPMPYPGAKAAVRHFRENVAEDADYANALSIRKGKQ